MAEAHTYGKVIGEEIIKCAEARAIVLDFLVKDVGRFVTRGMGLAIQMRRAGKDGKKDGQNQDGLGENLEDVFSEKYPLMHAFLRSMLNVLEKTCS